jgi:hypothetical protein
MTTNRIHEVFKTLGKLIHLDHIGRQQAADLKAAVVALQEQNAWTDGADRYAELEAFLSPTLTTTRPAVQSAERVALSAQAGVEAYLRAIAPELGQPPNTTATDLAAALGTRISSAGETITQAGGFDNYVGQTWAVLLPTADAANATIPDAWINLDIN